MQLSFIEKMREHSHPDAAQVVIRDRFGAPVLLAVEVAEGQIYWTGRGLPDFEEALYQFGLADGTVTKTVQSTAHPARLLT